MNTDYIDPIAFQKEFWPDRYLWSAQREIVYSVEENAETLVVTGNGMGKDYVTGFIVPCKFLRALKCGRTCRIVTSSATDDHLDVVWAEINDWIRSSKYPLLASQGGPLVVSHHRIRLASDTDSDNLADLKSYAMGKVAKNANQGEGLAGHHAQETLAVGDEASSLDDVVYKMFQGWASGGKHKRMLFIGNPNPCQNFFFRNVKAGDLVA